MVSGSLIMFVFAAVVCFCAASVVALYVAIVVDLFKTLGKRSWRLAFALILMSVIAGVAWSELRNDLTAKLFAITVLCLLPVIKFCVCWQRNSMPKNRYYATALKMSFMPCSLIVGFGAIVLCGAFISDNL